MGLNNNNAFEEDGRVFQPELIGSGGHMVVDLQMEANEFDQLAKVGQEATLTIDPSGLDDMVSTEKYAGR